MKSIKPGIYKHFKGGEYRVVGVGKHSESLEDLVIYEALYDNPVSKFWLRPLADFAGKKEINGKKVKRFTLIKAD